MTDTQKERCYQALLDSCAPSGEDYMRSLLRCAIQREIEILEPIIDELAHSAFRAGLRFGKHKSEEQILKLEGNS